MEFKSFYKQVGGNEGTMCNYSTRLDTYGRGCNHDCKFCYAKSLLDFRGLWNAEEPAVADIEKVRRKIQRMPDEIVRLGGMTDCFMPIEREHRVTYETLKAMNDARKEYLIVTKSDIVADDDYIEVLDRSLAHIQFSITFAPAPVEKASSMERRIAAAEKLQKMGYDVAVRLSPFVPEWVDFGRVNEIQVDKILVEFLRVNHWIMRWLDLDYSAYTVKHAGYRHLPLERKIELLSKITGYREMSVCEDVPDHKQYWVDHVNQNKNDCCNLRR